MLAFALYATTMKVQGKPVFSSLAQTKTDNPAYAP